MTDTPISPMDCETPKATWGSCVQALASGWILTDDLCPVCTGVFMRALSAAVSVDLEWHRSYRDRLASGGYPRFYRWDNSHFYRVDAPDRVWFRTNERNEWTPSGARTEASLLNADTATFERYFPETGR